MRMRGKLIVLGVIVAAGAGGGAWYWKRAHNNPYAKAEQLADAGNLRGALLEMRNASLASPNSPQAHLEAARIQAKLANPVAAEREFRIAAGLGADKWQVIPELGEAMLVQGRYQDVLAQIPAHGPTPEITAKMLLLRAISQLSLGNVAGAAATLKDAQTSVPGTVQVPLIAARVAAARDDVTTTEAMVDETLRIDPTTVEALLMKEHLVAARGDHKGALDLASRAVAAAPWSAMAHIDRAYQYMALNNDAAAQADVNSVLDGQPRFIDAIFLNGVLTARRGKYADAALQLAVLDGVGSRFPQAVYYQAKIAAELGQKESAADLARRYNTMVPLDPDGVRLLAATAMAINQAPQALPVLEKAVAGGQRDAETLQLLGRSYAAAGNGAAAVKSFREAAAVSPDNPTIQGDLGLALLQQRDVPAAIVLLEKALAMDPKMVTVAQGLTEAYLQTGDIAKAEAALAKFRVVVGNTESVGIMTGLIRLRNNDPDGAQTAWTNTLKAFPNSAGARFQMAKLRLQQGRTEDGTAMLQDILASDPANVPVLTTYLPLLLASGRTADVLKTLQTAQQADRKQQTITGMLADTYIATGKPQQAITLMQDTFGDGQMPPLFLTLMARAQTNAGMVDAAKATYRTLLQKTPDDLGARVALAGLLITNHEEEKAKDTMREALARSPGNLIVMTNLVQLENATKGMDAAFKLIATLRADKANMPYAAALKGDLLMRSDRQAEAAQAYLAEFKADPSAAILLRMSAAFAAAGQDDQAASYLKPWLKDHPDQLEPMEILGQLAIKAKRYDEAQTYLNMALARAPDDVKALNNLASVYFLLGDKRARATAQHAYLKEPSPMTADTLGWIMTSEGASSAAVPLLRLASKQQPADLSIKYHLAAALNKDGKTEEATELLQTLVDGSHPFDEQPDARKLLQTLSTSLPSGKKPG